MIILGIDPGLALMGYGIIEFERQKIKLIQYGCIETQAKSPTPQRLRSIFLGVNQLIDTYKPDEIAFEELFFARNVTTAMNVGAARGVALVAAAQRTEELYEYTPMQIKQAVTGYGKADKAQVQQMVKMITGMDSIIRPDDAADAVAAAICHAHSRNARQMFKIT
ncbi:MAG: crossover junction endodeoxyribonuclease RuvC [Christensenellales bacterium]|jgi:crossover junction endodeoxyribonuclease RuvC|nr:crossover junction endodeoxyribonuclease RuvC [Clostridiales bacterium]MDY4200259.1 crossover junction endodeoxyribonuclease RuvC [Candidatus Fimadaptatus sp.]